MNRGRYSLLGLGHPRSRWFTDVAQWSTSGVVSVDFSKCVSAAEIRLRLNGLERFSAVLIEDGVQGLDRDLLDIARSAGAAPIVIKTTSSKTDWIGLGASLVLNAPVSPAALLEALIDHAAVITAAPDVIVGDWETSPEPEGMLVAVCGPGGTGASTLAIALAQGLASDGNTALCDFARNAEQAVLHDATERVPGVEDLVDVHRTRRASPDETRSLTFDVEVRGYRLLLGQRRNGAWSAMPPRAIAASMEGLRRAFRFVVADTTSDFEGESDGGSLDVEERNALARTAVRAASVVVVVGTPGLKGIHSLGRTIRELNAIGVDNIVPAINFAPRPGLARSSLTKALSAITEETQAPIFIPRADVDGPLHDVSRLPNKVVTPITTAVQAVVSRTGFTIPDMREPVQIIPGELGLLDASG